MFFADVVLGMAYLLLLFLSFFLFLFFFVVVVDDVVVVSVLGGVSVVGVFGAGSQLVSYPAR